MRFYKVGTCLARFLPRSAVAAANCAKALLASDAPGADEAWWSGVAEGARAAAVVAFDAPAGTDPRARTAARAAAKFVRDGAGRG